MIRRLTKVESVGWRMGLAFADEVVAIASFFIALWLRFEHQPSSWILDNYVTPRWPGILLSAAFYFLVLAAFRMYQHAWRFAGLETAWAIVRASIIGAFGMAAIHYCLYGTVIPRSVVFLYWLLSLLGIASLRLGIRLLLGWVQTRLSASDKEESQTAVRTMIVGAAEQGAAIVKAISHTSNLRSHVILGFLDDRPDKEGMIYGGVRVLGNTSLLKAYLDRKEVDEVVFALSDESDPEDIRGLVLECRRRKVLAKVIPDLSEQLLRPNSKMRLEDIRVEDLLRRPMRSLDLHSFGTYITGKRVLVTGAGGSIGSEICRQVMKLNPAEIVLLGHGENSIFQIEQELRQSYPEMVNSMHSVICSVKNASRIERVFGRFKPNVVFHAAAHKHLPLMEYNVCEAVHNNILGTNNVVNACLRNRVDKMVMISTDKAADPSCIMGATKALCETVVKSAAQDILRKLPNTETLEPGTGHNMAGVWPTGGEAAVVDGLMSGLKAISTPAGESETAAGKQVAVTATARGTAGAGESRAAAFHTVVGPAETDGQADHIADGSSTGGNGGTAVGRTVAFNTVHGDGSEITDGDLADAANAAMGSAEAEDIAGGLSEASGDGLEALSISAASGAPGNGGAAAKDVVAAAQISEVAPGNGGGGARGNGGAEAAIAAGAKSAGGNGSGGAPTFVCVRFGNVLGSRGSVIPVFNEQIRSGGPVTVTHPDMTRYFMTIPEAVRLVIEAGAVGKTGDIYLLDMGKPVKIMDLAEDMIRLHGYEPNVDIAIQYTGIRPGEKMHEQLSSCKEEVVPSGHDGLNLVKSTRPLSQEELAELVGKLQKYVEQLDGGAVIELFQEMIPGYACASRAGFTRS